MLKSGAVTSSRVQASRALPPVVPPKNAFRLIAPLGVAISSLALTFAAHSADLALGEQVFNNNCAACHMGGKNSVIPEKTLNKAALEQYLAGGFKLESIITQVTNGKGAMPAWGNVLDEDEIDAVANYVFETSTAGKW